MRKFIARHPLAFLTAVLGGIVAATGLGSVALGAGVPVTPLLYTQLGIYAALPFAILASVPEREGGAVAMAVSAALPLLTFFAWLEHRIAGNSAAAFTLTALGASLIVTAIYWLGPRDVPVFERARAIRVKPALPEVHGGWKQRNA